MPAASDREGGAAMLETTVQTHLDQLEKPLRYAMRQNFAHLAKLRDLEAYVQHHVQALQALALPPALQALLQQLRQAMQSVDTLPLPQKQERVRQAEQLLAQMRALLAHDTAPALAAVAVQATTVASCRRPRSSPGKTRLTL